LSLIVVTGADGFIGSHLTEALVARGHRVRALVHYNAFGTWGWLDSLSANVLEKIEVIQGDIRDADLVRELLRDSSLVYHLAALIAIPYSYKAPRSYIETNVIGTLNVLEAAREFGLERVIQTSTSEVFGSAQFVPMSELHPLNAQSPYAASKVASDQLAASFYTSFNTPVVTLRPFNTFGPRQSARAVIPTVITQLAAGQSEIKLGTLETTRDFTFVLDTVAAFLTVGEAPLEKVIGQVFNAGCGQEYSIGQVVQTIQTLMRKEARVISDPERIRPERSEVMRLVSDSTKLRNATGWESRYSLEMGLKHTIDWFTHPERISVTRAQRYGV
jgi:NDP-hexose 4,6-dehydratase